MLNDNERKKYETIKRVIAGELTRKKSIKNQDKMDLFMVIEANQILTKKIII